MLLANLVRFNRYAPVTSRATSGASGLSGRRSTSKSRLRPHRPEPERRTPVLHAQDPSSPNSADMP